MRTPAGNGDGSKRNISIDVQRKQNINSGNGSQSIPADPRDGLYVEVERRRWGSTAHRRRSAAGLLRVAARDIDGQESSDENLKEEHCCNQIESEPVLENALFLFFCCSPRVRRTL